MLGQTQVPPARYSFTWDDQGDLGVWVLVDGQEVLVEALVLEAERDYLGETVWGSTAAYVLASDIELGPEDSVEVARGVFGTDVFHGRAAHTALRKLQDAEKRGAQVHDEPVVVWCGSIMTPRSRPALAATEARLRTLATTMWIDAVGGADAAETATVESEADLIRRGGPAATLLLAARMVTACADALTP